MWLPDFFDAVTQSPVGGQSPVTAGTAVKPGQTDGSRSASKTFLREAQKKIIHYIE